MKKEKDNILLEDYTKLKKIGDGGYATVYKVRHNELEYIRAIRVLKENVDDEDDPVYKKFISECKVLLRLGNGNHPNIVHIYQPLFKAGKAFVEMDYITGEDIKLYIERVRFVPIKEVIRFAKEIASALAYCHIDIYKYCYDREIDNLEDDPEDGTKPLIDKRTRQRLIEKYQVIHNDIHSGNIMRREDGHYILLDFGLSIQNGEIIRKSQRTNGAPEYKSPEKWENDSVVSTQSDIYSFGVVLYEMLTGHVPFVFNKDIPPIEAEYELQNAHKKSQPNPVVKEREKTYDSIYGGNYQNDIPEWLIKVVEKCLSKKIADRYANGRELYDFILNHEIETTPPVEHVHPPTEPNRSKGHVLLRERKYKEAKRIFATEKNFPMAEICTELICLERKKKNGSITQNQQKRLDTLYREYDINV